MIQMSIRVIVLNTFFSVSSSRGFPASSNGNLKPHPSFHRLHPYAVFPCMIWPVWHTGHDKSCSFGFFSVDVLLVVFFFPGLADVVDFFFGSSGGGAAVILPELSLSTYKTISPTIFSVLPENRRHDIRCVLFYAICFPKYRSIRPILATRCE